MFGYTHLTGGYQGGQAEYVRVPFADAGPVASRRARSTPASSLPTPPGDGPDLYKTFRDKQDGCVKVVLKL